MLYLAKPVVLAGISGGRRRVGLGSTWDSRYHTYWGAPTYEFHFHSTRRESEPAESVSVQQPIEEPVVSEISDVVGDDVQDVQDIAA